MTGIAGWSRTVLAAPLVLALALSCRGKPALAGPRAPGTRTAPADKVVEPIFVGGYQGNWEYHGWADREPGPGKTEKLRMENHGGWILNNYRLTGTFGGLVFRFKAPEAWGDFLQVRIESELVSVAPVQVGPQHRKDLPDGWTEVFVPASELNPTLAPFKRVVLRATRALPRPGVVEFDQVGLSAGDPKVLEALEAKPGVPATFTVDCGAATTPISPLIYGIALAVWDENGARQQQWKLNPSTRRWGGNAMTRYNWELGGARNTAADWYFENVGMNGVTWKSFVLSNLERGVQSALTLPMIGWVAKDTRSVGFPVSEFGPQKETDGDKGAGNGLSPDGKPLPPGPPTNTSVAAPPEFIGRWVKAIRALDQERGARTVHSYILDNEPMLWSDTHRDVHPQPLTYDELLERTVAYASAIRKADPEGQIAGPAEWGWTAYFYSAADGAAGYRLAPDRRAHGNTPLIEWYLKKLAEHEQRTGERLLDVVDLHFYPQGKGVGVGEGGETDAATNALRIRSTRALWDPSYTDESWIKEPVMLIPRMREWVARNYPGRKLSLGEYSFGAEKHLSGGLALAEALGRFGQHGLYSAYYWTYPAENTPAHWAFRAYRNYDGQGATFLDQSMPATAPADASVFASRASDRSKATVVLLNFAPATALEATLSLKGCPAPQRQRVFSYSGGPAGLAEQPVPVGQSWKLRPSSITVVELGWDRGAWK